MKTQYDNELIKSLDSETVEFIEETESTFNEIESLYPLGHNGIDWTKKKYKYSYDFRNKAQNSSELIEEALNKIAVSEPELLNSDVVVVGDGLTELSYRLKFKTFLENAKLFLSIPQHTYVWFPDTKECLNVTFENEVFFG